MKDKVIVSKSILTDIGDAIREKEGSSSQIPSVDMAARILALPSGGITPTGTIEITQQNNTDVTNYAIANVKSGSLSCSVDYDDYYSKFNMSTSSDYDLDFWNDCGVTVAGWLPSGQHEEQHVYLKIKTTSASKSSNVVSWGTGWINAGSQTVSMGDMGYTRETSLSTEPNGYSVDVYTRFAKGYHEEQLSITISPSDLGLTSKTSAAIITKSGGTVSYSKDTYCTSNVSVTVTMSDLGYTKETQLTTVLNSSTHVLTVKTTNATGYHESQLLFTVSTEDLGILSKQAATITPGTTDQIISAGVYIAGAQTIKGDSDLVSSNIKKGVTIFNVTGSYEGESSGITPVEVALPANCRYFTITNNSGYALRYCYSTGTGAATSSTTNNGSTSSRLNGGSAYASTYQGITIISYGTGNITISFYSASNGGSVLKSVVLSGYRTYVIRMSSSSYSSARTLYWYGI